MHKARQVRNGRKEFPSANHMEMKIVNPLEIPEWNDVLATHPDSSFFHTANWARVLSETYRYRLQYFVSANGSLETLIPFMEIRSLLTGKRGVSLPFTDYSAPIFGGDTDGQASMNSVIHHGKTSGWNYIDIRNPVSFPEATQVFSTYRGHVLDLTVTEESLSAALRDSTKRNIKKAMKEGVTVAGFSTEESIREFYRLQCLTRKEHGLPPQPVRFFKNIYEHVIARGLGFVALASYKNTNIAGVVCFFFGGKAIFKYGASDKMFQKLRANNLAMWETIRLCVRHGGKSFCFGRTELSNDGLMQFKSGWGAKEHTIRYYRYDLVTDTFLKGNPQEYSISKKIFKVTPIFISRVTGEILYRHFG